MPRYSKESIEPKITARGKTQQKRKKGSHDGEGPLIGFSCANQTHACRPRKDTFDHGAVKIARNNRKEISADYIPHMC
jgi:hypothetical protein